MQDQNQHMHKMFTDNTTKKQDELEKFPSNNVYNENLKNAKEQRV